jgi:O-antigen/teichoic acid export membrane protein
MFQQLKSRLGAHDRLLARGTSVALAGVVINMAMGLLLTFFKARVLDLHELGVLMLGTSISITVFFLSSGFSITMVRYGSLFRGQGSEGKIKSVAVSIYKLTIPIVLFLLVFLIIAAPYIAAWFNRSAEVTLIARILISLNIATPFIAAWICKTAELTLLIRILAFGAFFHSLMLVNVGLLKSKYLVKYEYIAMIGQLALIGLIGLIFIQAEDLVLVFAIAYPVASLIVFIYSCFVVRREFGFIFDNSFPAEPHNERPFRFAMFSSITTSLSKFRDEINIFLIAVFLLEADVALYGVAFKVAFLPLILTPAVNAIFTPMVGDLFGKRDIASIKRLHLKVSGLVAGFAMTLVLVYVVGAKYILMIFGPEFASARTALLVMALANVAAALAGPMGFAMSMMGRPHFMTANSSILLILMMGLCYYLIPEYGINGAAVAYAISNSFICLICLLEVSWLYRVESRKASAA